MVLHNICAQANALPFEGSWNTFQQEIAKAFERPNRALHLRRKILELKQHDCIVDYVYKFRNLIMQVGDMSEVDRVVYFLDNLKPKLKERLI